jgi:glucuronosyltransferase
VWLECKEEKSVVYVSMGSHTRLNKEKGEAILNGVLSTNYSLLWSLRESNRDILDGVKVHVDDKRVRLLKWVPQLAVLGHRAVGVAIVHGGANSVHESLYNEVPLIVLPGNGDQMANAGRVHHQGLGIHLQDSNVTESSVFEAIKQIDEGAYRRNVHRLKKSFIDGGGRERAAELIEFYAEVGYSHLVPAYAKYDWSWIQYYNVDVYLVVTLFLLFVSYLTIKCCRKSFLMCRRFSKVKSD